MFFLAAFEWVKARVAAIVGGFVALAAIFALVKRSGRQEERVKQLEQILDNVRKKDETTKSVERLPSGDASRRLRDKWSRD